jgi:hypothetical protein
LKQADENFVSVPVRPLLGGEVTSGRDPAVYKNGRQSIVCHELTFKFNGQPSIKVINRKIMTQNITILYKISRKNSKKYIYKIT